MKKLNLSMEIIDTLNDLVGAGEADKAIYVLQKSTGLKCFFVKYEEAFASKYAPKGYGFHEDFHCYLFNNSNEKERKIFSYFLSNLIYADVFGW